MTIPVKRCKRYSYKYLRKKFLPYTILLYSKPRNIILGFIAHPSTGPLPTSTGCFHSPHLVGIIQSIAAGINHCFCYLQTINPIRTTRYDFMAREWESVRRENGGKVIGWGHLAREAQFKHIKQISPSRCAVFQQVSPGNLPGWQVARKQSFMYEIVNT